MLCYLKLLYFSIPLPFKTKFPLEFLGFKSKTCSTCKHMPKRNTQAWNKEAYTLLPSSKNFLVPQQSVLEKSLFDCFGPLLFIQDWLLPDLS